MTIKKLIIGFWAALLSVALIVILFFAAISGGVFGKLPTFEELENPTSSLATEVYSSDGVLMGKYYSQNRTNIKFEDLPDNLVNALIATEDARYFSHTGVDVRAIARAVWGVASGDGAGGGSTLTQQLAKNLFPREQLSKVGLVMRKFKEWVIAVKLERSYTKEEVLTMYLNTVEFSDNAFGVKSAAKTYFSKDLDSLNVEESAVLVGMLQAPYRFNPRIHPEASQGRRDIVLGQMFNYGYLSETQKDSLQDIPLTINFTRTDHIEGPAPYFREHLRLYLKRWCAENEKPDGTNYDIYKDGLRIYTTIDAKLQGYAELAVTSHISVMQKKFWKHWEGRDPWKKFPEEFDKIYHKTSSYRSLAADSVLSAEEIDSILDIPKPMRVFSWRGEIDTMMGIRDSIKYTRKFLHAGFMAMEPQTGHIKAWVGGINYKYFQYDNVWMGNRGRQVGSTFKPFVYAKAIEDKKYEPCYEIPNELVTFEKEDPRWNLIKDWTPKNSGGELGGTLSLKMGLALSVNTITAYLMHEMTPDAVIELTKTMGIDDIETPIEPYPSICLGTADIPLIKMLGSYTTFVNAGLYTEPIFIERIEDKNGNIVHQFIPERREALDETTSYIMIELMKNVISQGTGQRLRYMYDLKNEIVGKTGTTQNQSDGWFIGLTPNLIAGAWVGCNDRFVRFRSIRLGQGASTALPIWGKFFQQVAADSTTGIDLSQKFVKPKKLYIDLDCSDNGDDNTTQSDFGDEFDN